MWFTATLLAVGCSWWFYTFLRRRDAYQKSASAIFEAPLVTDDFNGQAQLLCEACIEESGACGCTLFLQPGQEESGFRRAAQAGRPAEETGPGVVKDLLSQAWDTGKIAESRSGGRWLLAVPVWPGHSGGGAIVGSWDRSAAPGDVERSLLSLGATVASLIAPRFMREGALARAHEEIQALKGEVAEESHLAGVGRLATGVAHELSTPLSAVLTMVRSLSRTMQDPVGVRRLGIIQDAVEKCKSIIEKLLVYSKVPLEDENSVTFSRFVRASTDMNRVIENSLEIMRDSINEYAIKVRTDLEDIPEIRANSTQWAQVFASLINRSKESFSDAETATPQINIHTSCDGQHLRIEFADNGQGISAEDQPHIFEPFYSASGTGLGSGLGLVLVRDVVRKHHGTIDVKSLPEQGSTFTIKIPVDDAEQK